LETIHYERVEGSEVQRVMVKMAQALEGEPVTSVRMACLAMAIILQRRDIDIKRLSEGVTGAAEWIATFLMEPEGLVN
jgi:hypothetical protein